MGTGVTAGYRGHTMYWGHNVPLAVRFHCPSLWFIGYWGVGEVCRHPGAIPIILKQGISKFLDNVVGIHDL